MSQVASIKLEDLPPDARAKVAKALGLGVAGKGPKPKRQAQKSELEECFAGIVKLEAPGLGEPERQHLFAREVVPKINPKPRRYRFDFAWPAEKVAVEIHGEVYGRLVACHACGQRVRSRRKDGSLGKPIRVGGYHTQGEGFESDRQKIALALCLGWQVLEVTGPMMREHRDWLLRLAFLIELRRSQC